MSGSMHGGRSKLSHWNSYREVDTNSQYSTESTEKPSDDIRPPDIGQRIHSLYKNQMYTDIKFVVSCGLKPKPYISAHKAILAVGSPKFADMLYGDPKEQKDVIQINNTPYHAFVSVIEYLYTDDVYFESDFQVLEILAAAKSLEVSSLATRCESYVESAEISETNVCTKLQLATAHKLHSLKERCKEFIQENTAAVINSFHFKRADRTTVRNICKLQKLSLSSEKDLLFAVMEWIEEQPACGKNQRDLFNSFLHHIRFLALSCTQYNDFLSKYPGVLKSQESLSILMYLSSPLAHRQDHALPEWCNKAGDRCIGTRGVQPPVRTNRHVPQDLTGRQILSLKPTHLPYANYVKCMLQLKCIEGHHRIKALKLAFSEPLDEECTIDRLVITVSQEPSKYTFKEGLRVRNSPQVTVPFTRKLLIRKGGTVSFCAEAMDVQNYKFLQFDEENSFCQDSPFVCEVGSEPARRRLFFIAEVIYEPAFQEHRPHRRLKIPQRHRPEDYSEF